MEQAKKYLVTARSGFVNNGDFMKAAFLLGRMDRELKKANCKADVLGLDLELYNKFLESLKGTNVEAIIALHELLTTMETD